MGKATAAAAIIAVVAVAFVGVMGGIIPVPWDGGGDGSEPLVDSDLTEYLIAQNKAYAADVEQYSDVEQMTDAEVANNGFSMNPPDGYRFTYERHTVQSANPDVLTMGVMDSVWYPGALVKLTNESGTTVPVPFSASRAPYTLSVNLEGIGETGISAVVSNPSPSAAREAVAEIVGNVLDSGREIPISYTCTIAEASSSQALYASLGTTAGLFGLKLSADVDLTKSTDKNVVVLVFKQVYFTVTMDPPSTASSVFSEEASPDKIRSQLSGSEALAYVDVDYGKVVVVQVETTKSVDEVEASFGLSYGDVAGLEASLKDLASGSDTRLSYMVYGGSSESLGLIGARNVSEIVAVLSDDYTYTAKPIQFKFRFLDGMPADFYTFNDYFTREVVVDTTDYFGQSFDGGDGSSGNPYLISTREQLELIREHPDRSYRLISDIDLSDSPWVPIGDSGSGSYSRFSGTLDGGGHIISGMVIDSTAHVNSGGAHSGLFAIIDNGTVCNLRMVGIDMSPIKDDSGTLRVGAIAGTIIGGTLSDIHVQGRITCSEGYKANVYAGGVVGAVDKFGTPHRVQITNCVSEVDLSSFGNDAYSGGIVGFINGSNTSISYCFNYGDVSSRAYGGAFDYKRASAGGIAGKVNSNCSMDHVFNSGRIDTNMSWGYRDSGGIIGNADSESIRVDTACFVADRLYEGGSRQGDVFCDAGRGKVSSSGISCIGASDTSPFGSWNLQGHGLILTGGVVVPLF